MADPLVEVEDVEARLGRSLSDDENTRASALILDVSGEIAGLVGDDAFQAEVPAAVVGVICRAVIRQFENPRGLTGETIGDYNWQANNGRSGASMFLTPPELRTVRRAAGLSGIGSVQMQGDMPLAPAYFDINTLTTG